MVNVTKEQLITDLQKIAKQTDNIVTRNFYRANGKYSERVWHKYFNTFTEFLNASGCQSKIPVQQEINEFNGDVWNIVFPKTNIRTLEQLLDFCKVDLSIWEVERFVVNKWEMGYKNDSGIADSVPLFQVKATLRKKTAIVAAREEIELLKDLAKQESKEPIKHFIRKTNNGNLLEINIPDVHFGKLAWGMETGYGPYDVKIASEVFLRALNTLLDRVKTFSFEQIIFIVGNDLLNSNDTENRTASGTIVTTDGRYHKTFYKVRTITIEAIERLREIAPVKVIMVPGNHDTLAVWHLGDSLECYFHKYEDVEIENTPKYRKYHEFGNVMLMFTHGDKAKRSDYPLLMATEQAEMFGRTKFREAHTGHTHMTKLDEQHGVRVRVLPALCQPDDWHSENGFVGNLRNAEAYVWNKTEGLIGIAVYNDDSQEQFVTKSKVVTVQ